MALSAFDPLQACVETMMSNSLHDRWLVRRLPNMVRTAGFDDVRFRNFGYVEAGEGGYMVTIIDRGADFLHASGQISDETATALTKPKRASASKTVHSSGSSPISVIAQKPSG